MTVTIGSAHQRRDVLDMAPDHRPAVRFRCSLIDSRRRLGLTFEQAWPDALEDGLRGLSGRDREEWAQALTWARAFWRAAYEREPGRSVLWLSD